MKWPMTTMGIMNESRGKIASDGSSVHGNNRSIWDGVNVCKINILMLTHCTAAAWIVTPTPNNSWLCSERLGFKLKEAEDDVDRENVLLRNVNIPIGRKTWTIQDITMRSHDFSFTLCFELQKDTFLTVVGWYNTTKKQSIKNTLRVYDIKWKQSFFVDKL